MPPPLSIPVSFSLSLPYLPRAKSFFGLDREKENGTNLVMTQIKKIFL